MKSPTQASCPSSSVRNRPRTDAPRVFLSFRANNAFLSIIALLIPWVLYCAYTHDNAECGAWGCEMSWMTPSYQSIDWPDNPIPRYTLHLYREMGWEHDAEPAGVPVIFVPGNAGSYQQVRSIASSAARQLQGEPGGRANGMDGVRNVDFFTVDLNEEFSAFHAPTLEEQATFIENCIRKVIAQYHHLPPADRPAKVTLLGHSMGGIAARLAITPETIDAVDMILTMSAPHVIPPLTLSRGMENIYRTINDISWASQEYPILISLCGGVSDTQIVSDSCVLPRFATSPGGGLAMFTTGMSHVWTGVDHQAMMWCHQIRWHVARTLLEMTRSRDRQYKWRTAEEWLLGHHNDLISSRISGNEQIIPIISHNMTLLLDAGASYQLEYCAPGGACQVQTPVQEHLPSPANTSAPFPLPGEGIKPGESMIAVKLNLENPDGELRITSASPVGVCHGIRIREGVSGNLWKLLTSRCEGASPIVKHVSISSTSNGRSTYEARYFPNGRSPVHLHSHISSSPFMSGHMDSMGIQLEIFQSRGCPVTGVKISVDIYGSLAKMITRYRMTVIAWIIGWTAIVILKQTTVLYESDSLIGFGASLDDVVRTWALKCFALLGVASVLQRATNMVLDCSSLLIGTVDLIYVPVIGLLAVWTLGIVCVLWDITSLGLWIGGRISTSYPCEWLLLRAKSSHQPTPRMVALLPSLLAILLVYLVIPDQLAFVIAIGVIWMSVCLHSDSHNQVSGTSRAANCSFSTSAMFLMLLMLPFHVPTLLVWGRSLWFGWKHASAADHNVFAALPGVLIASLGARHEGAQPNQQKLPLQVCRISLAVLAVAAFTIGTRWTWALFPICNVVLACMAATVW
ncbi:hypothetical protein IAU59_000413 [Kwoniella sp. CBS 9459]